MILLISPLEQNNMGMSDNIDSSLVLGLIQLLSRPTGEIPVFLACPDVDPMHSPKIGYSLCSQ